jgi:tetratricopeptide (TPR) repeat protein
MIDSGAALTRAIGLHRQGRLDEAASLYQEVLAREPRNVDALHLLGLAMVTQGNPQQAVSLIGSAVQLQPSSATLQTNLGSALHAVGRYQEALTCYERGVALQPDLAVAHRGRGSVLLLLGRTEAAVASLARATQLARRSSGSIDPKRRGSASIRRSRSTLGMPTRTTTRPSSRWRSVATPRRFQASSVRWRCGRAARRCTLITA